MVKTIRFGEASEGARGREVPTPFPRMLGKESVGPWFSNFGIQEGRRGGWEQTCGLLKFPGDSETQKVYEPLA